MVKLPNVIDLVYCQTLGPIRNMSGSQAVKLPNVIDLVYCQTLGPIRNMSGSQAVKLPNVIDLVYCQTLGPIRNMSGSQAVKLPNVIDPDSLFKYYRCLKKMNPVCIRNDSKKQGNIFKRSFYLIR